MRLSFKNVLVLAPHTDDGELGAGATIALLIERGANVSYAAFSTAEDSLDPEFPPGTLEQEVKMATSRLNIKPENLHIYRNKVRELEYKRQEILDEMIRLRKNNYDLVLMPSVHDIHQDHEVIAREGLRAFKQTTILGYELIWNNLSFNTSCFVRLGKQHVEMKCEALTAYRSQAGRPYMTRDFIMSLAKARGVQIGAEYAESFEVVRWVL
ncbi:MAG: PIG-L deacetylase family protein [Bacillota bacterium]